MRAYNPVPLVDREAKDRFLSKIEVNPENGCHDWIGPVSVYGYGSHWVKGEEGWKKYYVHRLAYVLAHGELREDMTLDHLCRNRACCNPEHLEPVSLKKNIMRGDSPSAHHSRKTHCHRGHEFTKENTGIYKGAKGKPMRRCKKCTSDRRKKNRLSCKENG